MYAVSKSSLVFDVKVRADIRQIVVQTVVLRGQINPVQIPQPLGLNQRRNGASGLEFLPAVNLEPMAATTGAARSIPTSRAV